MASESGRRRDRRLDAPAEDRAEDRAQPLRGVRAMRGHRYVVERRVERAKRLLRESDLPVAAIAVQTGFSSQSHLASVFKRTVGLTPSEYQRSGDR